MTNKGVKERRTELYVPHEGKILTFIYPMIGPNNYAEVGNQIDSQNLTRPTFAETVSLIYAAHQNLDNKYSKEIIDILKYRELWAFNRILYVPNEGAYIEDNPQVSRNRRIIMDKSKLIKRFEAGDKTVRFASFGFKIGEQSARELAKNKFVIALAGEEGAEKLAEIAREYSRGPHIWSFENTNEELISVPALEGDCGSRLCLLGSCDYDDDRYAFAFGKTKAA